MKNEILRRKNVSMMLFASVIADVYAPIVSFYKIAIVLMSFGDVGIL